MTEKLTIVEKAFDLLSSIPHVKKVMKGMWWFQLVINPVIYFIGFSQQGLQIFREPVMVKSMISFVFGIAVFAYMFYLWDRRDLERRTS